MNHNLQLLTKSAFCVLGASMFSLFGATDNVEALLAQQSWYGAEQALKEASTKRVLNREEEEQLLTLQKFIKDEQLLEAAKLLVKSQHYYGALQCLKKIGDDYPKIAEAQELKLSSEQLLSLQEAEELFKMGHGEKSLSMAKNCKHPKATALIEKVEKVLDAMKESQALEQEFEFAKAQEAYAMVQQLVEDGENAYSKKAQRYSTRLGDSIQLADPNVFGAKVVAEGVRRWEKGDLLGAKKAYVKAEKSVPALAKAKLSEIAKYCQQSFDKAQAMESAQPEEAMALYKKILGLVDIQSDLYKTLQKKTGVSESPANPEKTETETSETPKDAVKAKPANLNSPNDFLSTPPAAVE